MGQQIGSLELFIVTQEQRHLSHDLEEVAVCPLVAGKHTHLLHHQSIILLKIN